MTKLEDVYTKYWDLMPPLARSSYIRGDVVYILDETKLPHQLYYIESRDYRRSVWAIREMKTRAGGQTLTIVNTMVLELRKNSHLEGRKLLKYMAKVAQALGKARPTAPLLGIAMKVYEWIERACNEGGDIVKVVEEEASKFLETIFENKLAFARHAANIIDDGFTVLTHCNISGGMVLVARECKRQGKNVKYIVTETRPYLQGSRLTAWELSVEGFNVTLIPDHMVANIISRGVVDLVIVGCDRCARNGDIANKIGTFQIALACFEYNIPFYVWVTSLDYSIPTGKNIPIERRSENEMIYYNGQRLYCNGVKAYYPAFDITPAKYISGFITAKGVIPPRLAYKYEFLRGVEF